MPGSRTALHDSRPKHEKQPAADPEIQGSQSLADLKIVACRRSYGVVSEAASLEDMESRAKAHETTRDSDDNLRELRATRARRMWKPVENAPRFPQGSHSYYYKTNSTCTGGARLTRWGSVIIADGKK